MQAPGDAEAILEEGRRREGARGSLLKFTEFTYEDWRSSWHHRVICEWLERLESRAKCPHCGKRVRKVAVHLPPRHSKTELASRRFPAWYLGRHPKRFVIAASATDDLAGEIGSDVRDIVRSPEYQKLFDARIRKDKDAAGKWRFEEGAIFFTVGAGGTAIGRGAHLLVLDDVHGGRNKAESEKDRKRVINWYYGDMRQRIQRPMNILLIMTRWHEDDIAGHLMPPEKEWEQVDDFIYHAGAFHVVKMPAILNENPEDPENEEALWPGTNPDPDYEPAEDEELDGFPIWYLQELRQELYEGGKARDWQAQYQQDPTPKEGIFLKRKWFQKRWTTREPPPNHPDYTYVHRPALEHMRIIVTADLAVTDKEKANHVPDPTEIGVLGFAPDGNLYVLDWEHGQVEAGEWVQWLVRFFAQYRPQFFFAEKGQIRRATEPLIMQTMHEQRVFGPVDEDSWIASSTDKGTRALPLKAWSRSGRVIFPDEAEYPWVARIVEQIIGFPSVKFDDAFDALAIGTSRVDLFDPKGQKAEPAYDPRKRDRWTRRRAGTTRRRGGWRRV